MIDLPWISRLNEEIESAISKVELKKKDSLFELIKMIEPAESAKGLVHALNGLGDVLSKLEDRLGDRIPEDYLDVISSFNAIAKELETMPQILKEGHQNLCNSAPLQAVLTELGSPSCPFDLPREIQEEFVAHFYLAYVDTWAQMKTSSRRADAGRALRSTMSGKGFNSEKTFKTFYQQLDMSSRDNLAESISDFDSSEMQKAAANYLRTLELLFDGQIGLRAGGGSRKATPGPRYRLKGLPRSLDIGIKPTTNENLVIENQDPLFSRTAHEYGLAREEAATGHEAVIEKQKTPTTTFQTDRQYRKWRASQVASSIASSNQFLPSQWNQMNVFDTYVLVDALIELSNSTDYVSDNITAQGLSTLLVSSFCRGIPLAHALDMKVLTRRSKNALNHVLIKENSKGEWVAKWLIDSTLYEQGHRLSEGATKFSLTNISGKPIELDVPKWAAEILGKSYSSWRPNRRRRFFSGSAEEYEKAAKKWIRSVVYKNPGSRITLGRIEKYFVQRCMQSTTDLAITAYLHGSIHPIQITQLYYTAVSQERLAAEYSLAWRRIEQELQNEARAHNKPLFNVIDVAQITDPTLTVSEEYYGSRIVPNEGSVKRLVDELKDNINEALRIPVSKRRLIEFHNAYLVYTITFLAYSSGYRSVRDPLPDPRLLDPKTGFCSISDKDSEDSYGTRVVWLSPECVKQISNYREHLEMLCVDMMLINKDEHLKIKKMLNNWQVPAATERGRVNVKENDPLFFFLDGKGKSRSVKPKDLEHRIKAFCPLPLNANRHYLRTKLASSKCPKDITDAFMGHWQRGREPWAQYSSLTPTSYSQVLGRYLVDILNEVGWKSIKRKLN